MSESYYAWASETKQISKKEVERLKEIEKLVKAYRNDIRYVGTFFLDAYPTLFSSFKELSDKLDSLFEEK